MNKDLIISAFITLSLLSSYSVASSDPSKAFPTTKNTFLTAPDAAWGVITKPYPTAAWYANLAIQGEGDKEAGLQPIFPAPYTVRSSEHGLGVSLPSISFARDKDNSVFAQLYAYSTQLELAVDSDATFKRSISAASDLSVTLKYEADPAHYMFAPILRGAPYVTMFYHDLTPMLIPGAGLQSINEQSPGTIVTGSRFAIKMAFDERRTQTWILYSENPITILWKNTDQGWRLTTQTPYSGWLRIALLEDTTQNIKNDTALLDQYALTIPTSGDVTYQYDNQEATITYNWKTQDSKPPLMMALPHHQQILQTPTTDKIKMRSSKGELLGVVGSTWTMKEPLPKADFLEITDTTVLSAEQKEAILSALEKDAADVNATLNPAIFGVYSSGKRFARAARLALMADLFNKKDIQANLISAIETNLTIWIQGKNKWQLQYDTTWGGIIPMIDDYGSTLYNDHHFHYGYYVYTMAVLAKLDPNWLQQPIQTTEGNVTPAAWINILIRDYANPNHDDAFLPYARHTDPFDGHAYASGLGIAFSDGRNQESVSEAVNAYYAIALLGEALHDEKQMLWGKLLLAQELRAAHTYWQILRDSKVYSPEFIKDNQITAVLWDGKTDAHTWFGPNKEFTYGIEMMPFTAITSQLLPVTWNQEAYKTLSTIYNALPADNVGWKWIILKARILGAPVADYPSIWDAAMNSGAHDEGDSKTNTLFYISSFPLMKK
jgi:endo-1,3(4)-beta-glucanase